jgi:hypothetical protein
LGVEKEAKTGPLIMDPDRYRDAASIAIDKGATLWIKDPEMAVFDEWLKKGMEKVHGIVPNVKRTKPMNYATVGFLTKGAA